MNRNNNKTKAVIKFGVVGYSNENEDWEKEKAITAIEE